jgi:hypothetical protein
MDYRLSKNVLEAQTKVVQKQRTSKGTAAQTKIKEIKYTSITPLQRGLKDNE